MMSLESGNIDFIEDGPHPHPQHAMVFPDAEADMFPEIMYEENEQPQPVIVVSQPNFGVAEVRRRHVSQQPPPRKDAGASFILASISRGNERYELAKIDIQRRCAPKLERCYRRLSDLRRFFCCAMLLGVFLVVGATSISDQTAFVHDEMRPSYVRHGVDNVNLTLPAVEIQCSDIRSGVFRPLKDGRRDELSFDMVRTAASYLIREDQLPCICGPMVGAPRRYVAIAMDKSVLLHLHNPKIDKSWDGHIDDTTTTTTRVDVNARSIVTENQRMMFPERADSVDVIRFNTVRVTYQDDECRSASVVLRDTHAWCMQACSDLFEGKSVYDAANHQ